MLDLKSYNYYIKPGITDMRKSAWTLAIVVQNEMEMNPYDKAVYLFCGRSRKTVKAIVWDRNGWFEITKRLGIGMGFKWPMSEEAAREVTLEQIIHFLDGNDAFRVFPEIHPKYA